MKVTSAVPILPLVGGIFVFLQEVVVVCGELRREGDPNCRKSSSGDGFRRFPWQLNDVQLARQFERRNEVPVLTMPRLFLVEPYNSFLPEEGMRNAVVESCVKGRACNFLVRQGNKWIEVKPGDDILVGANHVFCACPDQDPGYAICPYATCDNCCQDYQDARDGL